MQFAGYYSAVRIVEPAWRFKDDTRSIGIKPPFCMHLTGNPLRFSGLLIELSLNIDRERFCTVMLWRVEA